MLNTYTLKQKQMFKDLLIAYKDWPLEEVLFQVEDSIKEEMAELAQREKERQEQELKNKPYEMYVELEPGGGKTNPAVCTKCGGMMRDRMEEQTKEIARVCQKCWHSFQVR